MIVRMVGLLAAFGAGVLVGRALGGRDGDSAEESPPMPEIRNAGPEGMTAPPNGWDSVDESSDESFPASDPPGKY